MPTYEIRGPLQDRVDDYLRIQTSDYLVEEVEGSTSNAILQELRDAEYRLVQLQAHIARLKQLLVLSELDSND